MTSFRALASDGDLDAVLAASHVGPVILFKHSQTCGVSLMMRDGLADGDLPAPVYEVVVQRHREVSSGLTVRLGIRHESPQVFVVVHGTATWHTSHNGVTPARIAAAWQEAANAFTATPAAATR